MVHTTVISLRVNGVDSLHWFSVQMSDSSDVSVASMKQEPETDEPSSPDVKAPSPSLERGDEDRADTAPPIDSDAVSSTAEYANQESGSDISSSALSATGPPPTVQPGQCCPNNHRDGRCSQLVHGAFSPVTLALWQNKVSSWSYATYIDASAYKRNDGTIVIGPSNDRKRYSLLCYHRTSRKDTHSICFRCALVMGLDPCLNAETWTLCGFCQNRSTHELTSRAVNIL